MAYRTAFSPADARHDARDEVHYRARARSTGGEPLSLLVVNTSASGLMARSDVDHRTGDRLLVTLPTVGTLNAEVRWALGGRIGCQFDRVIDPVDYYALLGALRR